MRFNEGHSSHPAPKGAALRVTFYWAIFAFLGYFLGYFLLKMPRRTFCKAFLQRGRICPACGRPHLGAARGGPSKHLRLLACGLGAFVF